MRRFLVLLLVAGCGSRHAITLEGGAFRASGFDPAATLTVTVAGAKEIPLFGEHRVEGGTLVFVPRFPLKPGLAYRAVVRPPVGSPVERTLELAAAASGPATSVVRLFPSSDLLPENLLRFYLHFSAPMSRGEAQRRVRLLGSDGRPVDLPFLEQELWDPAGTRLTLLFDPGRIKRGLKPREESGPTLEEGKAYELVVDREWPDAAGRPLREGFRRAFRAGPPDDRQPDAARWGLSRPRAGTREPLAVQFDEPLDEAMLHRLLAVVDSADRCLAGRIEIDPGEIRWRFLPDAVWTSDRFALVVDTVLEDRSGNSIDRPFEVDVFRPVERTVGSRVLRIPFEISR